jgi:sulfur relay (sulfurtransferase) DsrC/TusE family protein
LNSEKDFLNFVSTKQNIMAYKSNLPEQECENLPKQDLVNHPSHYQGSKMEVIDIIDDFYLNFNLGNAIKYILRADLKGNKKQDLEKAIWYLNRELSKFNG